MLFEYLSRFIPSCISAYYTADDDEGLYLPVSTRDVVVTSSPVPDSAIDSEPLLERVPPEIWEKIFRHCTVPTQQALALSCQTLSPIATRSLYHTIPTLDCPKRTLKLLITLARYPHLALHVRSLSIDMATRPGSSVQSTPPSENTDINLIDSNYTRPSPNKAIRRVPSVSFPLLEKRFTAKECFDILCDLGPFNLSTIRFCSEHLSTQSSRFELLRAALRAVSNIQDLRLSLSLVDSREAQIKTLFDGVEWKNLKSLKTSSDVGPALLALLERTGQQLEELSLTGVCPKVDATISLLESKMYPGRRLMDQESKKAIYSVDGTDRSTPDPSPAILPNLRSLSWSSRTSIQVIRTLLTMHSSTVDKVQLSFDQGEGTKQVCEILGALGDTAKNVSTTLIILKRAGMTTEILNAVATTFPSVKHLVLQFGSPTQWFPGVLLTLPGGCFPLLSTLGLTGSTDALCNTTGSIHTAEVLVQCDDSCGGSRWRI